MLFRIFRTQSTEEVKNHRLRPERSGGTRSFHPSPASYLLSIFRVSTYPTSFVSSPRKIRHPEQSASQIYRKKRPYGVESKDLGEIC
jgi:hypothetical protein